MLNMADLKKKKPINLQGCGVCPYRAFFKHPLVVENSLWPDDHRLACISTACPCFRELSCMVQTPKIWVMIPCCFVTEKEGSSAEGNNETKPLDTNWVLSQTEWLERGGAWESLSKPGLRSQVSLLKRAVALGQGPRVLDDQATISHIQTWVSGLGNLSRSSVKRFNLLLFYCFMTET